MRTINCLILIVALAACTSSEKSRPDTSLGDGGPWKKMSSPRVIDGRSYHSTVWTGSELIIWGGISQSEASSLPFANSGARFNPATNQWMGVSSTNAPKARYQHTAVWTGNEVIVWGGVGPENSLLGDGATYNVAKDEWKTLAAGNSVEARTRHTAVWTGSEMIVWGGQGKSGPLKTGAKYNPKTNKWKRLPVSKNQEFVARLGHCAVWTGTEMIIWGGFTDQKSNSGWRFNPKTNKWRKMNQSGAPAARTSYSVVWTGTDVVFWGGVDEKGQALSSGALYDPAKDSWREISVGKNWTPEARSAHGAVWTSRGMLIWGGKSASGKLLRSGAVLDLKAAKWSKIPEGKNSPSARSLHSLIYTGKEVLIWGGIATESTGMGLVSSGSILALDSL